MLRLGLDADALERHGVRLQQREFGVDYLLVRIHFIIVMVRLTGLTPWEFEFPLPGSLTSTFACSTRCQPVQGRQDTRDLVANMYAQSPRLCLGRGGSGLRIVRVLGLLRGLSTACGTRSVLCLLASG